MSSGESGPYMPRKQSVGTQGTDNGYKLGIWYMERFYECHPTKLGYFLLEGEEYALHVPPAVEKKVEEEEDIVTDVEGALKIPTGQDGDVNEFTTLGCARFADLARLDAPSLAILDDGIRSIRKSIIDNLYPPSGAWAWIQANIHAQLLALFHLLDIRYDDGRLDMDVNSGWERYQNAKLPVDARIRGILSNQRATCNNGGSWASASALDTLLEISRWRNIWD